jgi:hypothetical protein
MNKIKITSLRLETKDGKEIDLSLDEAKDLYLQLKEIFKDRETLPIYVPLIIDRFDPYKPYWYEQIWMNSNADVNHTFVECNSSSGVILTITGENYE